MEQEPVAIQERGSYNIKISTRLPPLSRRPLGWGLHPRLEAVLLSEERVGKYIFAPGLTRSFLEEAINQGAHLKNPSNVNDDLWIRRKNILALYFSTPATHKQLADIYGISRALVWSNIKDGIVSLWNHMSEETRQGFPLSEIPLSKNPLTYPPEYKLLVRDSVGNSIMEAIESGKTGRDVIKLIRKTKPVGVTVKLLEDMGIEIAGRNKTPEQNVEFIKQLRDETKNDSDVQDLLDQVGKSVYVLNQREEHPFLIHVINLARNLGLHLSLRDHHLAWKAIAAANIPMGHMIMEVKTGKQAGPQHYYFIAAWHEDRAIEALARDPSLQHFINNPVKQVCGESTFLPSTHLLLNTGDFTRASMIFKELGIRNDRSFFTTDCPVSVFEYNGKYFCHNSQAKAIREYVRSCILK